MENPSLIHQPTKPVMAGVLLKANSTFKFVSQQWRFLLFGALLTFWSGPGQTFVISLFGEHLRADFNLTHGEFGTIYTIATLISAALLWKTGPLVDHLPLRKFAPFMVLLMVVAIGLFAAIQGPITLLLGILFVRFMGQGMLNHIAITAMARRFEAERGRAISFVGLGFIIGESIFPPAIVFALGFYDWRLIWPAMALLAAVTFLPFIHKLIGHTQGQDGKGTAALENATKEDGHWTRADLLRDPRFYLLAVIPIAQSGIITGLFFHQVHIISLKGWSFEWWSFCFTIFAGFSMLGGLASGFIIDRFSARQIAPFSLLFMVAAFILMAELSHPFVAVLLMALLGVGASYTMLAMSTLWAELYGTRHLGAIRSVANVVMVFGSALGPVIMGLAFDAEISLRSISYCSALIAFLGVISALFALKYSWK